VSEQEPKRIPINIIEAIDHNKPVVEQIQEFERFKEVVNRALGAAGIELVTMAVDVEQSPSLDVDPRRVSPEHVIESAKLAGQLSEARLFRQELAAILDEMSAGEEDNPASRMLDFNSERISKLKAAANEVQGRREKKRVPLNLLDALDKDSPNMEEDGRMMLAFQDAANRVLRAYDIVLVSAPAEEVDPQLSGDLTMEQASQEILASRLGENEFASNIVGELVARIMAEPMNAVDVLAEINEKIRRRGHEIEQVANRKPE
jgi:hypothetical protein